MKRFFGHAKPVMHARNELCVSNTSADYALGRSFWPPICPFTASIMEILQALESIVRHYRMLVVLVHRAHREDRQCFWSQECGRLMDGTLAHWQIEEEQIRTNQRLVRAEPGPRCYDSPWALL
jgi:hypothetical protein